MSSASSASTTSTQAVLDNAAEAVEATKSSKVSKSLSRVRQISWEKGTFLKTMHSSGDGDVYLVRDKQGVVKICKFPWYNSQSSLQDYNSERSALLHLQSRRFRDDPRAIHVGKLIDFDQVVINPLAPTSSSSSKSAQQLVPAEKRGGQRRGVPPKRTTSTSSSEREKRSKPFTCAAMFLEFYEGQDLMTVLEDEDTRLTMTQIREIVRQVATALAFIHDAGVMHMDLKPENICFTSKWTPRTTRKVKNGGGVPCLKLIDFGLSEFIGSECEDLVGTNSYMAPEIKNGRPHTTAADIWSLGVLMYEMCMINDDDIDEIDDIRNYRDLMYDCSVVRIALGSDGVSLLKALLQRSPKDRLTAAQVLEHPYLSRSNHQYDSVSESESESDDDDDAYDDDGDDQEDVMRVEKSM